MIISNKRIIKALIRLRICAGWSAPLLFANPRIRFFSRRGPDIIYSCARIQVSDLWALLFHMFGMICTGNDFNEYRLDF